MVEMHKILATVKWVQLDRVPTNYAIHGYVAKISSPLLYIHDELVVCSKLGNFTTSRINIMVF